jgi:hypothetical protein
MAQGKRVEVSAEQRAEIWQRWKAGESLQAIGRAFGRKHTLHSSVVIASWWNRSCRPSSFTQGANPE